MLLSGLVTLALPLVARVAQMEKATLFVIAPLRKVQPWFPVIMPWCECIIEVYSSLLCVCVSVCMSVTVEAAWCCGCSLVLPSQES